MRKEQKEGVSKEFSLPKIKSKFNNSHQQLVNLYNRPKESRGALSDRDVQPKKLGTILNKKLDVSALEHLEFLNRI